MGIYLVRKCVDLMSKMLYNSSTSIFNSKICGGDTPLKGEAAEGKGGKKNGEGRGWSVGGWTPLNSAARKPW